MKEKGKNILSSVLLVLLGIVIIIVIPEQVRDTQNEFFGPRLFPIVVAIVLIVFSMINLITTIIKNNSEENEERSSFKSYKKDLIRVLLVFLTLILWTYNVTTFGFFATTLVVFVLQMIIIGERKVIKIVITSITFTIIANFTLGALLRINLPSGILF